MTQVVGVRFKQAGPLHYFSYSGFDLKMEDRVIAKSQNCDEFGKVLIFKEELPVEVTEPLLSIKATATEKDKLQHEQNLDDAQAAFTVAKKKIIQHQLEMKLVEVAYTFDRNKMIFYFTADGRIDFRNLVKDLAAIFKTRIELRQIGVRDEAKILGGIGPCGRTLCCSSFLGEFVPVSIKMAKDQNLSLNPAKISGICGRLMCCLQYENEEYEIAKKEMPDYGKMVVTPDGKGKVVGLNLLARVIRVRLEGRETPLEYTLDELNQAQKV